MNWALQQTVGSPAGKSVLLILANRADPEGLCYPGIDSIALQTELSRRTVIKQIKNLIDLRLVSSVPRHRGSGRKTNVYILHCAADAHCSNDGGSNVQLPHGAGAAWCSSRTPNVQESATPCAGAALCYKEEPKEELKEEPKGRARARRLPDDFALTPDRRSVAEAEKVPVDRTFAVFCDYWRSVAGQRARKHDWDATWRNWCRRQADMERPPNAAPPVRKTRYEQAMEQIDEIEREAMEREAAERRALEGTR